MAYLPEDSYKSNQPDQGAGQQLQLSSGESSSSNQLSGQNQPQIGQQNQQQQQSNQQQRGSGMGEQTKNLRQYVQQNQNTQLAQKIGENLTNKGVQVQQGIGQSQQKFQQQIAPEQQRLQQGQKALSLALNPQYSKYFTGQQQLAPEHIQFNQDQLSQAQKQYNQQQVVGLDQAKRQQYDTGMQRITNYNDPNYQWQQAPQVSGKQEMTVGQPLGKQQEFAAIQKQFEDWQQSQMDAAKREEYNKAITPEGIQAAQQKYYNNQAGQLGALQADYQAKLSPYQSADTFRQAELQRLFGDQSKLQQYNYHPDGENAGSGTWTVRDPNGESRQIFGDQLPVNDPWFQYSTAKDTSDLTKFGGRNWSPELQNQEMANTNKEYNIAAFNPEQYQANLRAAAGLQDINQGNLEDQYARMLRQQAGIAEFDPAAYEKQQEDALAAQRLGEVQQYGQTPEERLKLFEQLRNAQHQNFDVSDRADIQQKVADLQRQANLGRTESGRFQLLGETFNKPTYTTGQQRLDQLLLQSQRPQQEILKGVQQNVAKPSEARFQDLMNFAGKENTAIDTQAEQERKDIWRSIYGTEAPPAVDASGAYVAQGGQVGDLVKNINAQVETAKGTASKAVEDFKAKLAKGDDVTAKDFEKFLPDNTPKEQIDKLISYYNEARPESLKEKILNRKDLSDKEFDLLGSMMATQNFTKDQLKRAYGKKDFQDSLIKDLAFKGGNLEQLQALPEGTPEEKAQKDKAIAFAQNLGSRAGDWKMDFSKYLGGLSPEAINAQNIATPEEYARYAALQTLAGQQPGMFKPSEVGQAGTGLNEYGKFDIAGALNKGGEVFNPATYGNMQHVPVPNEMKGSTVLSDIVSAPFSGGIVTAVQFADKTLGVKIPIVTDIAEGVSGTIADMGRVVTGGRVICTELYEQGLLSRDVWEYEVNYGKYLRAHDPYVIPGYHFWAIPTVTLMKKSKFVTKLVNFLAKPWTNIEIREKTLLGKVYMKLAIGACRLIGKYLVKDIK